MGHMHFLLPEKNLREKFAMNLGAEMFIIKPEEPKALVQKLRQVFEKNDGKKICCVRIPTGKRNGILMRRSVAI